MKTQKEIEVIAEVIVSDLIENLNIDYNKKREMFDTVIFSLTEQLNKDVLKLYNKSKFTDRDNFIINECIEVGMLETDDILDDFVGFCTNRDDIIDTTDLQDFYEHYENGKTHIENWYKYVDFFNNSLTQ